MKKWTGFFFGTLLSASTFMFCQQQGDPALWNFNALSKAPTLYPVQTAEPGVRALYFESVPYQGRATRVFAYYGAPPGKHLPAMVLIHGGDGTAFAEWVRLWNRRGYAAIAIDTCGNEPEKPTGAERLWDPPKRKHEYSGPECWDASFSKSSAPIEDQWPFHAVAAAVLADSLLRSLPEIDHERIGITGISWGGFITEIVASVDNRFRFAAPVYGCGFLGEDSTWLDDFKKVGKEKADRWLSLWDTSHYLPFVTMPTLWVDGTNDIPYPFDSLAKSYRLPKGPRTLVTKIALPHNHIDGAIQPEIEAYADSFLKHGSQLANLSMASTDVADFRSASSVVTAELDFTVEQGDWPQRKWRSVPAQIDEKQHRIGAAIPANATAWFFSLVDAHGMRVSSEATIVAPPH
jgi:dienelactone hydrolase